MYRYKVTLFLEQTNNRQVRLLLLLPQQMSDIGRRDYSDLNRSYGNTQKPYRRKQGFFLHDIITTTNMKHTVPRAFITQLHNKEKVHLGCGYGTDSDTIYSIDNLRIPRTFQMCQSTLSNRFRVTLIARFVTLTHIHIMYVTTPYSIKNDFTVVQLTLKTLFCVWQYQPTTR